MVQLGEPHGGDLSTFALALPTPGDRGAGDPPFRFEPPPRHSYF